MLKNLIKRCFSASTLLKLKSSYYAIFGGNPIRGKRRNQLDLNDATLRHCRITFHGVGCRVILGGGNSLINCKLDIFGNNCTIIIGENNSFNGANFWLEDSNSSIIIGSNNRFTGEIHFGVVEGTALTIKDDCLFSSNIHIMTTDSHSIIDMSTGERVNPSKDVVINSHVWVGHGVSIGKGVTLAEDMVVGACSYIAKSIDEPHSIVAGVPAKVVRRNFTWNINRI